MNRLPNDNEICIESIANVDDAQDELHKRGWSVGHTAIDGIQQVSGNKRSAWIIAHASTELDAWLLACAKANESELIWLNRN